MDFWGPLGRIACPTLLVRDAESDILAIDIAKKMLQVLPEGRLVEVPEAGHGVPGDQPAAFTRVVHPFLAV
jgi:esterase